VRFSVPFTLPKEYVLLASAHPLGPSDRKVGRPRLSPRSMSTSRRVTMNLNDGVGTSRTATGPRGAQPCRLLPQRCANATSLYSFCSVTDAESHFPRSNSVCHGGNFVIGSHVAAKTPRKRETTRLWQVGRAREATRLLRRTCPSNVQFHSPSGSSRPTHAHGPARRWHRSTQLSVVLILPVN